MSKAADIEQCSEQSDRRWKRTKIQTPENKLENDRL